MAYVVREAGSRLSESAVMDFVAKQVCVFESVKPPIEIVNLQHQITLLKHFVVLYYINKVLNIQVAPYKRIRRVAFVASIPKNASGKILRKDLIKLATSKL